MLFYWETDRNEKYWIKNTRERSYLFLSWIFIMHVVHVCDLDIHVSILQKGICAIQMCVVVHLLRTQKSAETSIYIKYNTNIRMSNH